MTKLIVSAIVAVVVIALLLMLAPFTVVGAGEVAVVTRNGAVNRTLDAGLHGVTPIIESVHKIDVQVQKEQAETDAASKDLQSVTATVAVNYSVDPSKAADLYARIGAEYKARIIDPAIQEAVKAATSQYTAEELQSKRPQVAADIKTALSERLAAYDLTVTDVSVVNLAYSATFNQAIESKVAAEQNAQAAQFKLDQAKLEAEAIKVTSEAANNEKYVQLQQLKVQEAAVAKWDGKLPNQMIPGSALPFINLTNSQ